ncbi:MAG: GumC family protein [Petrimonas sp.]|jgi:capsular exopolysaccharide synthesis family protein
MIDNPLDSRLNSLTETENSSVQIIELIARYIKNWFWFVLCVILALFAAFVFLRYATPVYNIASSVKLKDVRSAKNTAAYSMDEISMVGAVDNVNDETEVMKSRAIVRSTINRLNLHTSYIVEGRIKDSDLYTDSPVIVGMEQGDLDNLPQNINFSIQLTASNVLQLKGIIGGVPVDTIFKGLPALLSTKYGNISFTRRTDKKAYNLIVNVTIQKPDAVIGLYSGNLTIEPKDLRSSVLNLSFKTSYPEKGKDFLNTLIDVYNNEMIEDKNMEARNTQEFINERLAIIDEELSAADENVQRYKQSQRLTDMQVDLQRNIQMGSQYEQQLVQVETQLNVVNTLEGYVNNPSNATKPIPSNIGIDDPTLVATANEYNRLLLERERMSQSMTDENPAMKRLDERISGLRSNINSSISSVQQGLAIQRRDARNQANIYGGKLGIMPTQEREFVDLTREQQIKQNLFLLLLQKREENALALAATSNTAKVLNEATLAGKVFPRTQLILLAALLLGLIIPAVIIFLVDLLQFRIKKLSDVRRISKVPILGEIPTHSEKENIAVSENDTSEVNEAFRMMRTNLMLTLGADNKAVVFTSTVSGEGKTFVAINTAISLSLLNKKVLLVEMDLRIPRIKEYMKIETKNGLTNFLSGFEKDINKLIIPSHINNYLYVLPSGPIPPNPSELLSRPTLDKALAHLKEEFDFIIIDSAPVSQVTDTLIINRISDATIYVARANFSSKGNLMYANDLMNTKKLKNMLLVINDVKDFSRGYGYGYGYGYGKKSSRKHKRKPSNSGRKA